MSALLGGRVGAEPVLDRLEDIAGRKSNMHATIQLDGPLSSRTFELRSTPRNAMRLPILIVMGGTRYTAVIRNLSYTGALIRTSAPLNVHMKIEFQCGSICAGGAVVWQLQGNFGIKFDQAICARQLSEQVLRSNAVADWCNGYSQASAVKGPQNRLPAIPPSPPVSDQKDVAV